ncbi:respiratory nitrate reductase subunit gamma [Streptomyces sp. Ac-502]|uniref:respiratory nitrate reductase subunit gamma n=1 Tax=Streptomyces sp. Ac-502 TaxID=3342801 RepID=UPI0038625542
MRIVYRRRTVGPVFSATTRNDKLMYVMLTLALVLGLAATVDANIAGAGYDYRTTVSPWFRSIISFRPDPALMSGVPLLYQPHALSALALFAVWPFTRLVHGNASGEPRDLRPFRERGATGPGPKDREEGPTGPGSSALVCGRLHMAPPAGAGRTRNIGAV